MDIENLFDTPAKKDEKVKVPQNFEYFRKGYSDSIVSLCFAFGSPDTLFVGHEGLDEDVVVDLAVAGFEALAELLDFIASHFFTEGGENVSEFGGAKFDFDPCLCCKFHLTRPWPFLSKTLSPSKKSS